VGLSHQPQMTAARHSVGASSDEESRHDGERPCLIALDAGSPMSSRTCSMDSETRVERRAADTGGQAASATLMARCKGYCDCKLTAKVLDLTYQFGSVLRPATTTASLRSGAIHSQPPRSLPLVELALGMTRGGTALGMTRGGTTGKGAKFAHSD